MSQVSLALHKSKMLIPRYRGRSDRSGHSTFRLCAKSLDAAQKPILQKVVAVSKERSKTETAQVNEALCKVLAHNICCLIQSMYELNIKPDFWEAPNSYRKARAEPCATSEGFRLTIYSENVDVSAEKLKTGASFCSSS